MLIRTVHLNSDLVVEFFDRSNRYFGNYHRLCVEARCRVPLKLEYFAGLADPDGELRAAMTALGGAAVFSRTMEKMGVAGEAVESTREALIDGFVRSSLPYLNSPAFPQKLIAAELARCRQGRHRHWLRR